MVKHIPRHFYVFKHQRGSYSRWVVLEISRKGASNSEILRKVQYSQWLAGAFLGRSLACKTLAKVSGEVPSNYRDAILDM